jgi:hypothetical protein
MFRKSDRDYHFSLRYSAAVGDAGVTSSKTATLRGMMTLWKLAFSSSVMRS